MKNILILVFLSAILSSAYSQDNRKAFVDSLLNGVEIKKDIQYNSSGRPLHLDIYYPQKTTENKLPCVVWIHGGGLTDTTIKKDYDLIRWGIARTTAKGYISVSIDYTLITESPLPKAIKDCETAIRFIKSHAVEYKIDTSRIAVVGESSGGYLAGFCSFACDTNIFTTKEWNQVTNKIACGVLWYPTIRQSPNYNMIDFISAGDIPVISIHGEVDHMVPIARSYQIQKKCEEEGLNFKLHIIKGADHGFFDKDWKFNEANRKNMEQAINITIEFLNNQLKLKSLDQIDYESYKARYTPFSKGCIPVELSTKKVAVQKKAKDIDLNGEWQVEEGGDELLRLNGSWSDPIKAIVPGSIHTALWKAGIIPDPYRGRNDSIAEKYSYKTWWYKKEFDADKQFSPSELIFDGVAVHCTVWLNGVYLGQHEGMFGGPSFDISKVIKEHNTLIVRLDPAPYQISQDPGFFNGMNIGWRNTVVFNCVYGWHYSKIPAIGIWRPVRIRKQANVEITNPFITTKTLEGEMNLSVPLTSISSGINGDLTVTVIPDNFKGTAKSFEYKVSSSKTADTLNFSFKINNPKLWWPNDMGEQNLYKLEVSFSPQVKSSPSFFQTIFGIRQITMAPLPGGPFKDKYNWTFVINGKPHFVKGNGWCTDDALMDFSRERYDRFLSLAKQQHIQLMRAWGGGMPETNDFYDLCDRYGIMVMQEWPTAWNSHETQPYDVLEETVQLNTTRLRNHPSLAMWGGGNESENPFGKAIDMMGRLSIELDNTHPFHRGEPWGGSNHNYDCWWGKKELDHNLNMTADFWGEFGIASAPIKESVMRYLPEDEKTKWPFDSASVFAHHTPVFNHMEDMKRLTQYSGYLMPVDNLDHFITGSQLAQVVAVRHTLERSRTRWPDCSGALYYKMNDNYPAVSWSCVDWYGTPKALHYFAQDAFSPLAAVVLFEHTNMINQNVSLPVFLLDDTISLANSRWKVIIRAYDDHLALLKSTEYGGIGNKESVQKLGEFSLNANQTGTSPLLIVSEIQVNNAILYRTFYFMNFEKTIGSLFNLPKTILSLQTKGKKVVIKNTGRLPAVGVVVKSPGSADKFTVSDNYFWLDPGEEKMVEVNMNKNIQVDSWNSEKK